MGATTAVLVGDGLMVCTVDPMSSTVGMPGKNIAMMASAMAAEKRKGNQPPRYSADRSRVTGSLAEARGALNMGISPVGFDSQQTAR
jgi:hypothetical protein